MQYPPIIAREWGSSGRLTRAIPVIALASSLYSSLALCNPQGGQVVAGSASIRGTSAGRLDVTQNSNKAVIDWRSFSIDHGEQTRFQQPSSSSVALNRVRSAQPSVIDGALSANGRILLINENGVAFGKDSQVNVGSLVATTTDISNDDFMQGRNDFNQPSDNHQAAVINRGRIEVTEGGAVVLAARHVANEGTIKARLGNVVLASGETFTVDFNGDGLFQFDLGGKGNESSGDRGSAANSGRIIADGGVVEMTAQTADAVVERVINMDGVIQARTVASHNGAIVLSGGAHGEVAVSGTLDASGPEPGQAGGDVKVLGQQVSLLADARIDASGNAGGGQVLVGGNYQGKGPERNAKRTTVAKNVTIKADAVHNGDGGQVIVWADETAEIRGDITARGGAGSGDGGLIETSAKRDLIVTSKVDASAPKGKAGTWMIDPTDIDIVPGDVGGIGTNQVAADKISTALSSGTNVVLDTSTATGGGEFEPGDITQQTKAEIKKTAGGDAKLTLNAQDDIILNSTIEADAGQLSVTLNADRDGNGAGAIVMNPGSAIRSNGGDVVLGGGADPLASPAVGTADHIDGILISGATIDSGGGSTSLRGTGFADADDNFIGGNGIVIGDGSVIKTNGAGTIEMTGTGGIDGYGILLSSDSDSESLITVTTGDGAGAITLTTDRIAIEAQTTISGSGLLKVQPLNVDTAIAIGTEEQTDAFSLRQDEIDRFADGFSQIVIGRDNGQHQISVSDVTFIDPVLIQSPNGGSISVNSVDNDTIGLRGQDDASVTLAGVGATTTLNADIVTSGESILIEDSVLIGAPLIKLDTTADEASGAAITIDGTTNSTSEEANSLVLTAGLGAVTLVGDVGANEALDRLAVDAFSASLSGANDVSVLAANITGDGNDFSYTDLNRFEVGTVGSIEGVTTNNGPVALAAANGFIDVRQPIDTGTGDVMLDSNKGLFIFANVTTNGGKIALNTNASQPGSIAIFGFGEDETVELITNGGNFTAIGNGNFSSEQSDGILMQYARINTGGGNIALTGNGLIDDGVVIGGNGIFITDGSVLETNGAGAIEMTGTGGGGLDEYGILLSSNTESPKPITVTTGDGTGAITLTTDRIGIEDQTTISGSGLLRVQPLNVDTEIAIGSEQTDAFALSQDEIDRFADGFSQIVIGRDNGQHQISVTDATFIDPVLIQTPNGGSIAVNSVDGDTIGLRGQDNASVTLGGAGATTTLNADIVTSGQSILIRDSVVIGAPSVTLDTTAEQANGSAITIVGSTDSTDNTAHSLFLTSGSGAIDLSNVGSNQALGSLTATGAMINLLDVTTTGRQDYTGAVVLNSVYSTSGGQFRVNGSTLLNTDTTVNTDGGEIAFNGSLNGANALTLAAGDSGDILFNGDVGTETRLARVNIESAHDVTLEGRFIAGPVSVVYVGDFTSPVGSLNVASLFVDPAADSARLFGSVAGEQGDDTALAVTGPRGDVRFTINGCTIGIPCSAEQLLPPPARPQPALAEYIKSVGKGAQTGVEAPSVLLVSKRQPPSDDPTLYQYSNFGNEELWDNYPGAFSVSSFAAFAGEEASEDTEKEPDNEKHDVCGPDEVFRQGECIIED